MMEVASIAGLVVYWVAFGGMFACAAPYTSKEDSDDVAMEEWIEIDNYTTLADASSILHAQPDELAEPKDVTSHP